MTLESDHKVTGVAVNFNTARVCTSILESKAAAQSRGRDTSLIGATLLLAISKRVLI